MNFAVWCATAGCDVSVEDHLQATDPLLASLYRFHVYFTTRHILEELRVALPGEKSHSWYMNTFDARAQVCRVCGAEVGHWRGAGVGGSRHWRGAGVGGSHHWRRTGVGGISARVLRPSA